MTFQEAEKTYEMLRSQHAVLELSDADFESQVNALKVQDPEGRWWQIGVRTGEWYLNDGQRWVKSKPLKAWFAYSSEADHHLVHTDDRYSNEGRWMKSMPRVASQPAAMSGPSPETQQLQIAIIAAAVLIMLGLIILGLFFTR